MNVVFTEERATRQVHTLWSNLLTPTAGWPVATGVWLIVAFFLSVGLKISHSPLRPLPGVITLLLIPGASVLSVLQTRPSRTAGRLVLAVSMSMVVIMVVGCAMSVVGPYLGVARPLDPLPQELVWSCLGILIMVLGTLQRRDPVKWLLGDVRISQIAWLLTGGILAVLSILGAAQLNYSGNNHLAIAATALDVIVLLLGVVGGWRQDNRWPLTTLLYCASLALLLSSSLRGAHLYGWDIQKEFGVASRTIASGRWSIPASGDAYASMLSLTVLPAILVSLARLHLLAFFQLVVPAILALLPVAVFTAARDTPRFVNTRRRSPRPGIAFVVVASLIVSSTAFSSELVSISRQAMALTMLTALVMVAFDRAMPQRSSQTIIGILLVAISFTHYTTSYLLAAIFCIAWALSFFCLNHEFLIRKVAGRHRIDSVDSRKILNLTLVFVAVVAAFGWNLGITRNHSLINVSSAVSTQGAGFVSSTGPKSVPPHTLELILESELHRSAKWLRPVPGSKSVQLLAPPTSSAQNKIPMYRHLWNSLNFLLQESLWLLAGIPLLLGLLSFVRKRSYFSSADIVGFTFSVLLIGGILRFSGTLANFYSPSRAAIFVAIFVAVPITMLLDDLVELLNDRMKRLALILSALVVGTTSVWATGVGDTFFGGVPPGSLTSDGVNAQDFTVSIPEFATAIWIKKNVGNHGVVQTDKYGQLVLLSEPANYDLIDEIVPTEVGTGSYIYLSTSNLLNGLTTGTAAGGSLYSVYQTTTSFFNRNFDVVYSTGATRVYH